MIEAVEMPVFIDQTAAADGDHLVDAVGELIAPVFDMDRRLVVGHVAVVDVGDSRHAFCRCRFSRAPGGGQSLPRDQRTQASARARVAST